MHIDMLGKSLEEFLRDLTAQGVSDRTVRIMRSSVGQFIGFLRKRGLSEASGITRQDLSEFSFGLLSRQARRGKSVVAVPFSAASRCSVLCAVKRFFRFLKMTGTIGENPALDLPLPRINKKIPRETLTPQDVEQIADAADRNRKIGLRDRAIILTLYATGIRSPELARLKIDDIDFTGRFVTVRTGKNGRSRTVPISRTALDALGTYLRRARPRFLKKSEADAGFVFLSIRNTATTGTPLGITAILGLVRTVAKKAGFRKRIVPHSFRYACATHMMRNGADIRFVQEMLGHKSLMATQGYTEVVKGDLKRAIARYHPRNDRPAEGRSAVHD